MKKILLGLGGVLLLCFITFFIWNQRAITIAQSTQINDVNLQHIEDGEYVGSAKIDPVKVKVKVIVQDGKIITIDILEHQAGKGYSAEPIVDDVVEKQSLKVDSISGATVSSKTILKAIENALKN